jgi:hypothetical protein
MIGMGHGTRVEGDGKIINILVGKSEEKKPLGRQRRRWKGDVEVDLEDGVDWLMSWNFKAP